MIFYLTSSRGRIQLCVANPIFKITIFRVTIRVPSQRRAIPLPVSAQLLQRLQPVRHVAAFLHASPGPVFEEARLRRTASKLQTVAIQYFSFVTSLNTTSHLIFESIPEVVRPWVTLSSHRRTAKLSGLSGFKPCAALNRNGMAKAARAGHTQRYAKLAAETAKHRKLQECKVFTWLFVRRKVAQTVVGSNFGHNSGRIGFFHSG